MNHSSFFAIVPFIIISITAIILPQARSQSWPQHELESEENRTSSVAYITIDEDTIEMNVQTNGQLAKYDLELPISVEKASIRSERDITCFFWTGWTDRATAVYNRGTVRPISASFSTNEKLTQFFAPARMLYCYDSVSERDSDDTFTIFVENESGMKDLMRLKARQSTKSYTESEDEEVIVEDTKMENLYAVLDLREPYPDLRSRVISLSLVRAPTAPRQFFWNNAFPRNLCTTLWSSNRGARFHKGRPLYLMSPKDLLRITCYRAIDSENARRNWQKTRWMTDPFALD